MRPIGINGRSAFHQLFDSLDAIEYAEDQISAVMPMFHANHKHDRGAKCMQVNDFSCDGFE
jgi:hypothetical protein